MVLNDCPFNLKQRNKYCAEKKTLSLNERLATVAYAFANHGVLNRFIFITKINFQKKC